MSFVNEIAGLVHGVVDRYSGTPNKNIGDTFLFVWKFSEDDTEIDPETGKLDIKRENNSVHQIADMSVIAFLKSIAAVRKSVELEKYSQREDMQRKIPNY